jgi:flagellar motor protein MotB
MKNDQSNIPFLKTKIGLTISFLISIFLLLGLFGFLQKLNASNKNKKQEQSKLDFYQSERQKIEDRLVEIDSEEGKDRNVRENYNLAKDGEGLVVIIEEEDLGQENSSTEKKSFFDFFRKIFKKGE